MLHSSKPAQHLLCNILSSNHFYQFISLLSLVLQASYHAFSLISPLITQCEMRSVEIQSQNNKLLFAGPSNYSIDFNQIVQHSKFLIDMDVSAQSLHADNRLSAGVKAVIILVIILSIFGIGSILYLTAIVFRRHKSASFDFVERNESPRCYRMSRISSTCNQIPPSTSGFRVAPAEYDIINDHKNQEYCEPGPFFKKRYGAPGPLVMAQTSLDQRTYDLYDRCQRELQSKRRPELRKTMITDQKTSSPKVALTAPRSAARMKKPLRRIEEEEQEKPPVVTRKTKS